MYLFPFYNSTLLKYFLNTYKKFAGNPSTENAKTQVFFLEQPFDALEKKI